MGWLARRRAKQAEEDAARLLALIEQAIGDRGALVLKQMFVDQGIDPNNLRRSLKGDKGDPGEMGATGPMGPAGKDGYDYRAAVNMADPNAPTPPVKRPVNKTSGSPSAAPSAAEVNAAVRSIKAVGSNNQPDPAPAPAPVPVAICDTQDPFHTTRRCNHVAGHAGDCSWYVAPDEPMYREDDEQPYCADGSRNPRWDGWSEGDLAYDPNKPVAKKKPAPRKRTPSKTTAKKVAS